MGWPYDEPLEQQNDLFEEILSWLPPSSLLSFKSVSKSWHSKIISLTKQRPFALKQVRNTNTINNNHNPTSPSPTTLVFRRGSSNPTTGHRSFDHRRRRALSLLTLWGPSVFSLRGLETPANTLGGRLGFDTGSAWAYRHCNGLVCLVDMFSNLLLFNPETRRSRIVPKTSLGLSLRPINSHAYSDRVAQGLGFGCDVTSESSLGSHKIVIVFSSRVGKAGTAWAPGAEVYDLCKDTWRVIGFGDLEEDSNVPDNFHWGLDKGVYCDGFYYWLVKGLGHKKVVISFDFESEAFSTLPLPSCPQITVQWTSAVWKGSLALLGSYAAAESTKRRCVDVWAMDGGVEGGWIKRFSVGPFEGLRAPLAVLESGELLLETQKGEKVTCDPSDGRLEWLGVGSDDCMDYWGSYVKTVASLEN